MQLCRVPKKQIRKTKCVCQCGCGEPIIKSYQNSKRFKQGHYRRWIMQQIKKELLCKSENEP